jgi:hypothetical protein
MNNPLPGQDYIGLKNKKYFRSCLALDLMRKVILNWFKPVNLVIFKKIKNDLKLNSVQVLLVECKNISHQLLGELEEIRKTYPEVGIVILALALIRTF